MKSYLEGTMIITADIYEAFTMYRVQSRYIAWTIPWNLPNNPARQIILLSSVHQWD